MFSSKLAPNGTVSPRGKVLSLSPSAGRRIEKDRSEGYGCRVTVRPEREEERGGDGQGKPKATESAPRGGM